MPARESTQPIELDADTPTVVIVLRLEAAPRLGAWGTGPGALERLADWLRHDVRVRLLVEAAAALEAEKASSVERAELNALLRPSARKPADSRGRWVVDRYDLRVSQERELHLWHGRDTAACGMTIDPVDTAAGDGTRRQCRGCQAWALEAKRLGRS